MTAAICGVLVAAFANVPASATAAPRSAPAVRALSAASTKPGWTPGLASSYTFTNGTLKAVSCVSESSCETGGDFADGATAGECVGACPSTGHDFPLALGRKSALWKGQPMPIPPAAYGTSINGLSCTNASSCVAVGAYGIANSGWVGDYVPELRYPVDNGQLLAEMWNGSAWSRLPQPTIHDAGTLLGVSCTVDGACMAVGQQQVGPVTEPFAERWDGTQWTTETVPFTDNATFTSVSCTASTSCTAAGHTFTAGFVTADTLVERWDGTSWSTVTTPDAPGAAASFLQGVSCVGDYCVAVGYFETDQGIAAPFAETGAAGIWTAQPVPLPTGSQGTALLGVSCTASSACTAVGDVYFGPPSGAQRPLAYGWNGSAWKSQPVPEPAGTVTDLLGAVSCVSATSCFAVGTTNNAAVYGTPNGTLAERWNGTAWTVETTQNAFGVAGTTRLNAISCTTHSTCMIVGNGTYDMVGSTTAVAEIGNPRKWLMIPPKYPGGANLLGVSCASLRFCVAVGRYDTNSPLAQRWNGTHWHVIAAHLPAGTTGAFNAVSCPAVNACTIVGAVGNGSPQKPIAARWNGKVLRIQHTAQLPSTAYEPGSGSLNAVSCPTVHECIAVGTDSATTPGPGQPLAVERWAGKRWHIQHAIAPANESRSGQIASVNGISCPTSTWCAAVGTYSNADNGAAPLAMVWNGQHWTANTAAQKPSLLAGLSAVSCRKATSCTAVGTYTNSTTAGYQGYDEVWNGSTWTLHHTAGAPLEQPALSGVSCARGLPCIAAGTASLPARYGTLSDIELAAIETHVT